MKNKEIRFYTTPAIEIRNAEASEGPGTIAGYAAVYDSEAELGWFREVIRKGAFGRAIEEEQDVRALWNHDTSLILGRRSAGTLTLEEDDTGLRFALDLPDTQAGRDALTSIKRGDITGMSFGFEALKTRWVEEADQETELRELLDLNLFEVSPVTFPAYDDTRVAQRAYDTFQAERARSTLRRHMQVRRLRYRHHESTRRF